MALSVFHFLHIPLISLQPLDRGVYGPLKRYVFSAQDAWMKNNPLRTMTIYDLPAIAREALPKANVPANINGFKKCGIFPFNRDIFEEHDFAPSSVSDRDLETQNRPVEPVASCSSSTPPAAPEEEALSSQVSNQRMSDEGGVDSSPGNTLQNPVELPQCSNLDRPTSTSAATATEFSPRKVRPLPKAPPRTKTPTGKRKRHSAVLTDTPEKKRLEEERDRKQPKNKSQSKANSKTSKVKAPQKENREWFCLVCNESFSNSLPGEKWIMCASCQEWAHEECTMGLEKYICHHCMTPILTELQHIFQVSQFSQSVE